MSEIAPKKNSKAIKAASNIERALTPRGPLDPAVTRPRHARPLALSPHCDPSAV